MHHLILCNCCLEILNNLWRCVLQVKSSGTVDLTQSMCVKHRRHVQICMSVISCHIICKELSQSSVSIEICWTYHEQEFSMLAVLLSKWGHWQPLEDSLLSVQTKLASNAEMAFKKEGWPRCPVIHLLTCIASGISWPLMPKTLIPKEREKSDDTRFLFFHSSLLISKPEREECW